MTVYNPQVDNPIQETDRLQMHPSNVDRSTLDVDDDSYTRSPGRQSGWTFKTIFEYLGSNLWLPAGQSPETHGLMAHWHGIWQSKNYPAGAMVNDEGFLMISNKSTAEKAGPVLTGAADFIAPDAPVWVDAAPTTTLVITGHRYTFSAAQFISKWRVWTPAIGADINYHIILTDITDPANEFDVINQPINIPLDAAWVEGNIAGMLVFPGQKLEFLLLASNNATTTDFTGSWDYNSGTANTTPVPGNIYYQTNTNILRIHVIDDNTDSKVTELDTVVVGTRFVFGNGAVKQVEAIVTGSGTVREYLVSNVGEPLPLVQTVTGEVPTAAATEYSSLADHWATNEPAFATIESLLSVDGDPYTVGDELMGVDLETDGVTGSDDWDIMATV